MRKLEYTITDLDGATVVRQVMKDKLRLSDKEISHAKHFDDGITAELNLRFGGEGRRRLHANLYERCQEADARDARGTEKDASKKNADNHFFVKVRVNETLYPGEILTVTLHEMEDDRGRIIPVPGPVEIIYEDDDIILLNKPAGIVAHPSPGHTKDSLSNHLAFYYEAKNDPHRIRIIGRLDKEASGVLLFAKTRMAAGALRREGAYDKEYLAVCSGFFSKNEESGTIKFPIMKRPEVILKREISPDGEKAVTHYRVLLQGNGMALVRLTLETGRTHQIRLHMAKTGHPLIGDRIYGPDADDRNLQEQSVQTSQDTQSTHAMLHAEKMHIVHPVSGKEMTFTAEIPPDMQLLIGQMRKN